ncbi:hypothetical protein ACIQVL_48900 [Streptomyces sp. NPDC090499]|uniref:hypothetical protein n=1 Tax=Streptomyces sp. NPDC090499 TaxID=3365965 RepID=UPI003821756A
MDFIADKTRELRDAVRSDNATRVAQILTETTAESGLTWEDTIQAMTDTDRRQQGAT